MRAEAQPTAAGRASTLSTQLGLAPQRPVVGENRAVGGEPETYRAPGREGDSGGAISSANSASNGMINPGWGIPFSSVSPTSARAKSLTMNSSQRRAGRIRTLT